MKLFVNKTVKFEVINIEFLSRDLPLNNSAIMVNINENVWNYYIHQKECVGLTVNLKN